MGAVGRVKTNTRAHMAALRHGRPSRRIRVIFVAGQDGAVETVAFLASILRASGAKVGVMTQQYIEVAGRRVEGSDQADINGDPFRLQALLAQMRKAKCKYAVIEVPPELPPHQFVGVKPHMVLVRSCGDTYTDHMVQTARLAMVTTLLARRPRYVVYNRDDASATALSHLSGREGVISFGVHQKAEAKVSDVLLHPKGTALTLLVDHQTKLELATELAGRQTVYNVAAAAAAGYVLHTAIEAIEKGVRNQPPLPGRFEYVAAQRPYQIVLDAAATPGGVAETLETLKHLTKNRLIVAVGAPLGAPDSWLHTLGETVSRSADRIVLCDNEYAASQSAQRVREAIMQGIAAAGGEAKTDEIPDRREAIHKAIQTARRGDVVLVAATTLRPYRQMGKERLTWDDHKVLAELFEP